MSSSYHDGSRRLQDRFDTRRLAERLEEKYLSRPTIDADDRAFIERMDMFFLATADADGRPQCSYKGGDPGFVQVLDERTIAFPNYDGNGMYLSMGNLLQNPHVGMLFIDFVSARPSRLRLSGIASIDEHDELIDQYPGAQLIVRARATQVFPNCPRYTTVWRPSNDRDSCHAQAGKHRSPTGRSPIGRATCCQGATRRGGISAKGSCGSTKPLRLAKDKWRSSRPVACPARRTCLAASAAEVGSGTIASAADVAPITRLLPQGLRKCPQPASALRVLSNRGSTRAAGGETAAQPGDAAVPPRPTRPPLGTKRSRPPAPAAGCRSPARAVTRAPSTESLLLVRSGHHAEMPALGVKQQHADSTSARCCMQAPAIVRPADRFHPGVAFRSAIASATGRSLRSSESERLLPDESDRELARRGDHSVVAIAMTRSSRRR
ncbi:MAG: pyridoxamine 5'-phosphate oxidase family protein [Solirubrobacteraceae bacterium]